MESEADRHKYADAIIERGVLFLLLFTPLAFGAVQDWSAAIMELVAFTIFGAWLYKMARNVRIEVVRTPLMLLAGLLIGLVLFQLVPLPPALLKTFSPATAGIYDKVFGPGEWGWRTMSIHAGATLEELMKVAAYISVFFVIVNHYRRKEQVRTVFKVVTALACFLVLFAVIQKLSWNGRLYWFYPIDPDLLSRVSHIWGPYINRNHFAGYLEMVIPLTFGMSLYRSSSLNWTRSLSPSRKFVLFVGSRHFPEIAAWSFAGLLLSAAVFLTLSRGAVAGLTISILIFAAMARSRRSLKRSIPSLLVAAMLVLFVLVLSGWDAMAERFEDLAAGKVHRLNIWADTTEMIRDFPVFGTGLGTFASMYPRYQTGYSIVRFEHAENDYLELASDLGAAGVIAVGGLLFVYSATVLRAWRKRHDTFVKSTIIAGMASCGAIAVHSLTDFNMRIPANAMLLTVIAAISYASVLHVNRKSEDQQPE